jgi:iron complex outermembrane receptor protein
MLQYSVQITSFLNRSYSNMMRGIVALVCAIATPLVFADADGVLPDATDIPLEQLINTEFIPANRIANQVSNASSAVSIVTAQDIKDYGYRTLAEILNSMRGLQTPGDADYIYLGGRGFSDPGDYAGRIIVLIDGYRADDSLYGQAYLGNDGILDVALIERVEYISGGGAVGYGDGALLGAINIITKKGSDINGVQLAAGYGNYRSHQERATFGQTLKNGADVLLSASTYNSRGRDFPITDYDTGEPMHEHGMHGEDNKRLFFKGTYEGLTLQAAWAKRNIGSSSGSASEASAVLSDDNAFARLKYDTDLTQQTKLSSSIWYGQYMYRATSVDPLRPRVYGTNARWHGAGTKLVGLWFDRHTISLGAEYRNDFQWYGFSTDNPNVVVSPRHTYSLYAYDDFKLNSQLSLNFGVRYEKSADIDAYSPRGAIVWKPWEGTVLKLTKGVSHRQPTGYDNSPNRTKRPERPERADTEELVWEQQLAWQTKLLGSVYSYDIAGMYAASDITTRGAELEFEKNWEGGTRLRTSYAWQSAEDTLGNRMVNAPYNIIKFNVTTPLLGERLRMGLAVRHIGSRMLINSSKLAAANTIADLTLNAPHVLPNVDASFTVRNLFNQRYEDVAAFSFDGSGDSGLFPQDGRNFWLNLEYNFK